MDQLRLFGMALIPSLSSFAISLIVGIVFLNIVNWKYLSASLLPGYSYILSNYDSFKLLSTSTGQVGSFLLSLSGLSVFYNIGVFIVSVIIGILFYTLLRIVISSYSSVTNSIWQVYVTSPQGRLSAELRLGLRFGLRIAFLVTWFVYWLFFIHQILPYIIYTSRMGFIEFYSVANLIYSILGTTLLVFGLHGHVVFARLVLFKSRIYGNVYDT